jgi:Family of unknown function (DUF5989)
MNGEEKRMQKHQSDSEFERAAQRRSPGIVKEFVGFLTYNKKWWLAPIIIVMLLLGLFIILGGTGIAPFIYTLF